MTTVEGVIQRYSSPSESQQLCDELGPLLAGGRSPVPVKCTKKLYNCFVNSFDEALAQPNGYETICVLLNTLRYISNGSPALTHGFMKFVSFGLIENLCISALKLKNQPGWSKAADEILFTLTVIMNHSSEVKQNMIPMLPTLLAYVSHKNLPCSAKIEATRGCNTLLEECSIEHRCTLSTKPQIKKLIQEMGNLVVSAGDIELQVTMVECLFRLTSIKERSSLAQRWFRDRPAVLKAFSGLRDSEFEVDCRSFLNLLNVSVGKKRTVYSLPCKRAFLGTFELHRPADPGITEFWIDFNTASQTIALFVEDPYSTGSNNPEETMWEYVIIRRDALKHWAIEAKGNDLHLKLEMTDMVHSLLPNLSDDSHTVLITFGHGTDPSYPCELVFGPALCLQHREQQNTKQTTGGAKKSNQQASTLSRKSRSMQEISPIELPPNTPATGGHVDSQDSDVTPDHDTPPTPTPATSTPKPRSFRTISTKTTPSSANSKGVMRPSLIFSSGGEPQSVSRKASLAMNTVVLGSKSRVVATAQTVPLKTVTANQRTLESKNVKRGNDLHQAAHGGQSKVTPSDRITTKRRPLDSQQKSDDFKSKVGSSFEEQTEVENKSETLNLKKTESQTRQLSRLSTKNNQKPSAPKKSAPSATKPAQSKAKSVAQKSTARDMTSTTKKPLTCQKTASRTITTEMAPVSKPSTRKKPSGEKPAHRIPASPDPYDITSPDIDYNNMQSEGISSENGTTAKSSKSNTSKSSSNRSYSTSKSVLGDVTNQSLSTGVTQLNKGGKVRVFNLSAAPLKSCKKGGRGRSGKSSGASSLNSSPCSESELNAIPDSLPNNSKSTPYNSFLDDELEFKAPPPPLKQRKRIQVPINDDSFTFDSENESDGSWEMSSAAKKGKGNTSKLLAKKQPRYKATSCKANENARPILTGARTKKAPTTASKKVEQSLKALSSSKTTATATKPVKKLPKVADSDADEDDAVTTKYRASTSASLLGRKRVIDDIYDPDFTPELSSPKPKGKVAAKKPLPKKRKSCTTAAVAIGGVRTVEDATKETPSLPSNKKDTAARKLIMLEKSGSKPQGASTRSRAAALSKESIKKASTTKENRKQQLICLEASPIVYDKICDSPAIPTVSASKPDLGERARSNGKPKSVHSAKLDLYSMYDHDNDVSLVCPPSPKKPRLKQERRSSGYYSGLNASVQSSPSNSDHSSLACLNDNVQTNLRFEEDAVECSPISSHPPPSNHPLPQMASLPPSPPVSEHSSLVEEDLNITSGFEQICRDFIARSGKMAQQQPPPARNQPTTAKKLTGVKRKKTSEENIPASKKKRREQENHWEDEEEEEEVRDSPSPPPRVIKPRPKKQSNNKKSQLQVQKLTHSKKSQPLRRKPVPVSDNESTAEESESSDEESNSEDDISVRSVISDKKTARSKQISSEVVDFGSEIQDMIGSFKSGLNQAAKSRKVNTEKLASKATRGELLKLWVAHQKQRVDMSTLFQQQLCREIEVLEKEVKTTQGSEAKVSSHLKVCFKTMAKSLHKQTSQVDRLRALQVTYQEQVGQLEQEQEKQRLTAQRSLKKEMHGLQKRLLEDSQKQEVARIKKTLHTMLMQL